jgi:hypothetical protein
MSSAVSLARGTLFGAAVAAALAFGAGQALAAPRPCPLTSFGSCNSLEQCQRTCGNAGYPTSSRGCDGGCCYCVFI